MVFKNSDKEAIKQNQYRTVAKIEIIGQNIILTEDNYIVDFSYEDYRYVPNNGFIGQFVERILDGKLSQLPSDINLENAEINLKLGIVNGLNNETTFYDYGNFLITSVSEEDTSGLINFQSSDYTKKFNIQYVDSIEYPCLSLELLDNVCNQVGVELEHDGYAYCYAPNDIIEPGTYYIQRDDNKYYEFNIPENFGILNSLMYIEDEHKMILKLLDMNLQPVRTELELKEVEEVDHDLIEFRKVRYVDFINNDFVIMNNQYTENDSCREIIKDIAKLGYNWARVGWDNKLHIDFKKKDTSEVDIYDKLTTDEYYTSTKQPVKYGPVNKVLVGMSQIEGENITVSFDEDKLDSIEIEGKCEQNGEPTPESPVEIQTVKGVRNMVHDTVDYWEKGHYGSNGAKQNYTGRIRLKDLFPVEYGKRYILTTNNDEYRFIIRYYKEDGSYLSSQGAIPNLQRLLISNENIYYLSLSIYNPNDATTDDLLDKLNDGIIKPQIVEGSSIDIYTPYGNWLAEKLTDNLLIDELWEQGGIAGSSGRPQSADTRIRTTFINCSPNTEYTYSIEGNYIYYLFEYKDDDTFIKRIPSDWSKEKKYTFTTSSDTNKLRILVAANNGTDKITPDEVKNIGPQLFTKETIVKQCLNKENLFDGNNTNVLNLLVQISSSTLISSSGERTIVVSCKPNTDYSMSKVSTSRFRVFSSPTVPEKGSIVDAISTDNERVSFKTFTTPDNANYLVIGIGNINNDGYTEQQILDSIKIYEGKEYTDGYHELCSIGDVKDTFKDGIITKRIGKVVFNGYENWTLKNATGGATRGSIKLPNVDKSAGPLHYNNKLKVRTTEPYTAFRDYSYFTGGEYYLQIDNTRLTDIGLTTDLAGFKSWLSQNPVTIYYILEEPYEIKVDYEQLELFEGINNILVMDELKPTINVNMKNVYGKITTYSGSNVILNTKHYEECSIEIYDNKLTYAADLRRIAMNGADSLFGIEYTPLDIKSIGHPWLEGDELLELTNVDEQILYTYPFDRKINYQGYLTTELSSSAETKTQTQYESPISLSDRLNKTEIIVDKNNRTVTEHITNIETKVDTTAREFNDYVANQPDYLTSDDEVIQTITTTMNRIDSSTSSLLEFQKNIDENGINKVDTKTGFTFDENGLQIDKTGAKTNSKLDEKALRVIDKTSYGGETILYSGYVDDDISEEISELSKYKGSTVTYSKNLDFGQYLASKHWRIEEVQDDNLGTGLGFFYTGE